jgi:hypothetical protein
MAWKYLDVINVAGVLASSLGSLDKTQVNSQKHRHGTSEMGYCSLLSLHFMTPVTGGRNRSYIKSPCLITIGRGLEQI